MSKLFVSIFALHVAVLAQAGVEVVAAYQFPVDVCRLIVRNAGNETLALDNLAIKTASGEILPVLWSMAEPDSVPAGEYSFIGYMPTTPLPKEETTQQVLAIGSQEIAFTLERQPSLAICYSVYAPEVRKIYLYVINNAPDACEITAATVNGVSVALARIGAIPGGKKGLVYGQCDLPRSDDFEVPPARVRLTPAQGKPVESFARLFRPEHTVVRTLESGADCITCLTHQYETPEKAALEAISVAKEQRRLLRTIKFCNMDLGAKGPAHFAQIMERNHIEPQLTYAEACASATYVPILLNAMEESKCASEPGISYAWVFPSDIHSLSQPPFGVSRLRNMIYALVAGGSKGIELFPPKFDDPGGAHARANARLLEEIASLRELLAISEPVDLWETHEPARMPVHNTGDGFLIRTILCGDKGVLLFVLPKNDPPEISAPRATVSLRQPGYPLGNEAFEVGGAAKALPLQHSDNDRASLDVPLESHAQVFLIPPSSARISDHNTGG